jgi:hypothetical protein
MLFLVYSIFAATLPVICFVVISRGSLPAKARFRSGWLMALPLSWLIPLGLAAATAVPGEPKVADWIGPLATIALPTFLIASWAVCISVPRTALAAALWCACLNVPPMLYWWFILQMASSGTWL